MTRRESHPQLEEMLDRLRGKLSPMRADQLDEHRATCSRCDSAARWLEGILGLVAHGPLQEPPDGVIERAFDIVPVPHRAEGGRWSLAERIHDTLAGFALAGVRGEDEGERRVLYRTEAGDLDLEIVESTDQPGTWRVMGQFVGGIPATTELVALMRSETGVTLRVRGNDLGVFVFPAVAPGRYSLELLAPEGGLAIRVDDLELGVP